MSIKVKYRGKWLEPWEVEDLREQERKEAEAKGPGQPPLDVAALPEPEAMDAETPLAQLFFECPEVRPYITVDGTPRGGLTPTQQQTANELIARYGGPQ